MIQKYESDIYPKPGKGNTEKKLKGEKQAFRWLVTLSLKQDKKVRLTGDRMEQRGASACVDHL